MRGQVNSEAFDARMALVDRLPHMEPQPTLYDSPGGMPALHRLSDAFYERVLADELLAPVFASFTRRAGAGRACRPEVRSPQAMPAMSPSSKTIACWSSPPRALA
jgi:hypothetical protein